MERVRVVGKERERKEEGKERKEGKVGQHMLQKLCRHSNTLDPGVVRLLLLHKTMEPNPWERNKNQQQK